jgi:leader peptidase (prepilin peptidase)/N-methyltransferase
LCALAIYLVAGKLEEPEAVRQDRAELKRAAEAGDTEAAEILAEDPLGDEPPATGLRLARFPFGPFLVLACLEMLFAKPWISAAFSRFMDGAY